MKIEKETILLATWIKVVYHGIGGKVYFLILRGIKWIQKSLLTKKARSRPTARS